MKITISKILNKTDLAESGSHGGLVVTKPMINPLTDFFEETGVDRDFKDKDDGEIFQFITWITLQMEPRQMTE